MPNKDNSATEQRPVPSQAEGEDVGEDKKPSNRPVPSQAEGEDVEAEEAAEEKAGKPDHTE